MLIMKGIILLFAVCMGFSCVSAEYPYAYPGFQGASIYTAAGKDGAALEFRKAGEFLFPFAGEADDDRRTQYKTGDF